jgi:hypothetical protein
MSFGLKLTRAWWAYNDQNVWTLFTADQSNGRFIFERCTGVVANGGTIQAGVGTTAANTLLLVPRLFTTPPVKSSAIPNRVSAAINETTGEITISSPSGHNVLVQALGYK